MEGVRRVCKKSQSIRLGNEHGEAERALRAQAPFPHARALTCLGPEEDLPFPLAGRSAVRVESQRNEPWPRVVTRVNAPPGHGCSDLPQVW
jgi:hypothetical protein